jgi:uncharacterized protein YdiU (UPF0061 family)
LLELFQVPPPGLSDWLTRWRARIGDDRTADKRQAEMEAVNPALIARNHRIEEAIAAAIYGDFSLFHRLVDALANPYAEDPGTADLRVPPTPDERVTRTFCGT